MAKRIPLSQGASVLVDDVDFEALSKFKWYLNAQGYAARNILQEDGSRTALTMHRALLGHPPGVQVDHANLDRLDCRRSNLRRCNPSQNLTNRLPRRGKIHSQFKGVTWDASRGKWMAQTSWLGRHFHLGRFDSETDAAAAYDVAAARLHGEFARLNAA